jgi:hypothetical protein
MSYSKRGQQELTKEEWKELDDLRKAINDSPASVHPEKQERFTELFVRSLSYVGDNTGPLKVHP